MPRRHGAARAVARLIGRPANVGLLAAARGGLTATDLAELADAPLWDVESILQAAAGGDVS